MKIRWFGRAAAILGATALAAAPALAQTTHVVTVSGFDFVPQNITIQAGDSIMWTNLSGGNHNVAEANCPVDSNSVYNGGFYSGFPGQFDTYTLQFNTPGSMCYVCEPHVPLDMIGTITVQAGGGIPTMGEWGLVAMGLLFLGFGSYKLVQRQRMTLAPER